MLTRHHLTVAAAYLLLAINLLGQSPQFQAAFEKALFEIQHADSDTGKGNVRTEFESLLKLGSREDIAKSIAEIWANPERIDNWSNASSLAGLLGPQFDRSLILKSVKSSLAHAFNANAPDRAAMTSAQFLCNYGTPDDVEMVKQFTNQIKQHRPVLASGLEATLIGRENMIALKKSVEVAKTQEQSTKAPAPQPPPVVEPQSAKKVTEAKPTVPTLTPSEESTSSTPWGIIVVLIVAVTGLLWLLLRRRS